LKRALVTGGAGFVGSHVTQKLLEAGHPVLVVDNLATGSQTNLPAGAQFSLVDITDAQALEAAVSAFRPDVVIHQAAQTLVAASASDPVKDAEINVIGTLNVIKSAARAGSSKIVFASSGGTVYGDPERQPVTEEAPLRPISAYGVSKVAGENYLRALCGQTGMAHTILRYGNVFGPRDIPASQHVITAFLHALTRGQVPVIEWDGEQAKDYVYVGDVAEANLRAVERGDGEAFNVGSGRSVSVNEIFGLVCSAMEVEVVPRRRPKRTGDVRHFTLDCSKARALLGWEPRTPFGEALGITAHHYRDAFQTIEPAAS
jgi:UDP-glucose 4-epimerase